mgnify:CR=1 FL=1
MATGEPLTFEEFTYRNPIPRYTNFFLQFMEDNCWGQVRREIVQFKRFSLEHPKMEKALTDKITSLSREGDISENLKPFDIELYEAYLLMRTYVESDSDLWG